MSNSARMIAALLVGAIVGLFFGEMVGWMSVIGTGVILLMQMTVFPYIVVSLVGGIGSLTKENATLIFRKSGGVMVFLLLLSLVVICAMSLSFPEVESASFFSTSSVEEPPEIDYFKLYIPANPFESMAGGYVPAMVLFSIAMGLALIGMPTESKEQILSFTSTSSEVFSRITQGLLKVLPVGIFAMTASAAGTMGVDELASLQVYFVAYVALCAVLTFWVLPWLVASLTPVGHADILRIARSGMVTAFATGNVFIVLPVIIEESKAILLEKEVLQDEHDVIIEVLVPIAYSFPNAGKLAVIVFVLFAGWFTGRPIDPSAIPGLAVSGLLSLFGSVYVAIPFMLDLVRLPADVFQLFVMAGFITGRFGSVLAVLYLFAFTLLSVALFRGAMRFGPQHWSRFAIGAVIGVVVTVIAVRVGTGAFISNEASTDAVIANMRVAEEAPKRVTPISPVQDAKAVRKLADVAEIKRRGVLRVGYRPRNVPFSYYNDAGELVGYDIELSTRLANDLDVTVEFVAFRKHDLIAGLDNGYFDIAASGLAVNISDMQRVTYTDPVLELNWSLVVRDHRVKDFSDVRRLDDLGELTVAHVESDKLVERAKVDHPQLKFVELDHYRQFFQQKSGEWDALLISAQAGSAWTLFYPQYGVAAIKRDTKYPTAWALAQDNDGLAMFIDDWLTLQRAEGNSDRLYRYWILGQGAKVKGPRWSVVRNVLGWVD